MQPLQGWEGGALAQASAHPHYGGDQEQGARLASAEQVGLKPDNYQRGTVLLRSDTDSVCLELMPLGSQADTNAAVNRKKSKVRRTRSFLSQPTSQPL